MEPDRARRYASAAALAQDLSAALERRPIAARRAGPLRRARRWIARHPAGAAALGLTLLIVVGGPLLFGWQQRNARLAIGAQSLVIDRQRAELSGQNAELEATLGDLRAAIAEARTQRDEALAQEQRAERNLESAVAAVDTLLTPFADDTLRDVPRLHELRAHVLEDALGYYLGFLEQREDDPRLQRETARAWRRCGELHGLLDRAAESEAAFARSIASLTALSEQAAPDPALAAELARVHELIALPLRQLGRHAEAEEHARRGIALLEQTAGSAAASTELELRRLGLVLGVAQVLREAGRGTEARAELEQALPAFEAVFEEDPGGLDAASRLARAHHLLGVLLVESSHSTAEARARASREAEAHHSRVLELLEPASRAHPGDTDLRRDLARSSTNLGSAMVGRGAIEEAGRHLARGAELSGALRADYPGVATYVEDQATALMLLGAVRAALGDYDEGIATVREAAAAFEELAKDPARQAAALCKLASAQLQEATVARKIGQDVEAALDAVVRSTATHERALALSPGMPQTEMGLEWCHDLQSSLRLEAGDAEGAAAAALAWSDVVSDPRRRAKVALRLAICADEVEQAAHLSADERAASAGRYDTAAAGLLEQALAAGVPAQELRDDPTLARLLARPEASAPLGAAPNP
jgi:serine/threonine-protein kinase